MSVMVVVDFVHGAKRVRSDHHNAMRNVHTSNCKHCTVLLLLLLLLLFR
jgi:hypothetical protein